MKILISAFFGYAKCCKNTLIWKNEKKNGLRRFFPSQFSILTACHEELKDFPPQYAFLFILTMFASRFVSNTSPCPLCATQYSIDYLDYMQLSEGLHLTICKMQLYRKRIGISRKNDNTSAATCIKPFFIDMHK